MFMRSSRNKFTLLNQNSISFRHASAHPGGHQHGVSIQISINLGKTFLRISRKRNVLVTWTLARVSVYLPPCIFQILDLIYSTVLNFFFDQFWMAWHWKPAIRLCSQWKMLQCWRRTGHLPSFFVPTPGHLTAQESPPPGICLPRQKKKKF